jgi:hypothetical protein
MTGKAASAALLVLRTDKPKMTPGRLPSGLLIHIVHTRPGVESFHAFAHTSGFLAGTKNPSFASKNLTSKNPNRKLLQNGKRAGIIR